MPDSSPDDTVQTAQRILSGLMHSAQSVVCSYALTDEDTEQSVSELLVPFNPGSEYIVTDPGWHAVSLAPTWKTSPVAEQVPGIRLGEKILGGAAAIQRQLTDPVGAFIQSRLAVRVIDAQAIGIPAAVRGNLIHHALHKLYLDLPSSKIISGWSDSELERRIDLALDHAFVRHEKNADRVLRQLLQLERSRVARLLRRFVAIDGEREAFKIASVEDELEFESGPVRLPLRFDRIDQYGDGSIAILDYKTGARKQLLNRAKEVQEIQLFVYACATDVNVSALALVNIDSREISFDGAGAGYTDIDEWPALLEEIEQRINTACEELAEGDVRINLQQSVTSARPLNLLTRFTELRRDTR